MAHWVGSGLFPLVGSFPTGSLGGSNDESDSDEIYVPDNIDNLENSDSDKLSEVNDEWSGDDDNDESSGDDDNDYVRPARRLAITKKGGNQNQTKYRWRKKKFKAPQCQFSPRRRPGVSLGRGW